MNKEDLDKDDEACDRDFESKISIWKSMNEKAAEEINRASRLLDDELLDHPVIDSTRSLLGIEDSRKRSINKEEDRKKIKMFWTNEDQESNNEKYEISSCIRKTESDETKEENVNNQELSNNHSKACGMVTNNSDDLGTAENKECNNIEAGREFERNDMLFDCASPEEKINKKGLFNEISLNSKEMNLIEASILDKPIMDFDHVNNNLNIENNLLKELFKNESSDGRMKISGENNTKNDVASGRNSVADDKKESLSFKIPVFRETVLNNTGKAFANANLSDSKTVEIHSSKYMNGTIPIDVSVEVISHMESKISILSAQLENYKRTIVEKDEIVKNLRNSMELLFDELKNDSVQESIQTQASRGLEIIKEIRKREIPADKTQENYKLRIENMNLKNIIDELFLKIKILKDKPFQ